VAVVAGAPPPVVTLLAGALLLDFELPQAVRARVATTSSIQKPRAILFIGSLFRSFPRFPGW
jgi:hypothetical protein